MCEVWVFCACVIYTKNYKSHSPLPFLPTPIRTASSTLRFTGTSSIASYESLLRSLTYTNSAPEPTPGNRSITITISDGIHSDVTAVIVIVVLANDNPLTIQVC